MNRQLWTRSWNYQREGGEKNQSQKQKLDTFLQLHLWIWIYSCFRVGDSCCFPCFFPQTLFHSRFHNNTVGFVLFANLKVKCIFDGSCDGWRGGKLSLYHDSNGTTFSASFVAIIMQFALRSSEFEIPVQVEPQVETAGPCNCCISFRIYLVFSCIPQLIFLHFDSIWKLRAL